MKITITITITITIMLFIVLLPLRPYAQTNREAHFVLFIDEELVEGDIARNRILNGKRDPIEAQYYPGRLIFSKEDYDFLISQSSDSLTLAFDYYKDGSLLKNYELPFPKRWLTQEYLVMRIYNLEIKKYKKRFDPLDAKRNYTYQLDYPGGQMLRSKKPNKSKQ